MAEDSVMTAIQENSKGAPVGRGLDCGSVAGIAGEPALGPDAKVVRTRHPGTMALAALSLLAVSWGAGSETLRAAAAGTADGGKGAETQAVAPATPAKVAPVGDVFEMPKKFKSTRTGLGYVVRAEGTGPRALKGQRVTVHYTGWLTNGKKFDSSRDANRPFTFQLGAGMVIDGWDEGIAMMKVGDKYTFVIPGKLGYGAEGAPPDIPPKATLVFNVELLSAR